jgi:hypothetical protein
LQTEAATDHDAGAAHALPTFEKADTVQPP